MKCVVPFLSFLPLVLFAECSWLKMKRDKNSTWNRSAAQLLIFIQNFHRSPKENEALSRFISCAPRWRWLTGGTPLIEHTTTWAQSSKCVFAKGRYKPIESWGSRRSSTKCRDCRQDRRLIVFRSVCLMKMCRKMFWKKLRKKNQKSLSGSFIYLWYLFKCLCSPCFCFRSFPHTSHLNLAGLCTPAWFSSACEEDIFLAQIVHWNTVLQSCLRKLSRFCVLKKQKLHDIGGTFSCSMRTWASRASRFERSCPQNVQV